MTYSTTRKALHLTTLTGFGRFAYERSAATFLVIGDEGGAQMLSAVEAVDGAAVIAGAAAVVVVWALVPDDLHIVEQRPSRRLP